MELGEKDLALAEGFRGQDIVSLVALYDSWARRK